jgi:hypothetical protein
VVRRFSTKSLLIGDPDWETTHELYYDQNTALFPDEELEVRLGTVKRFTDEEIELVEEGTKRVHTWGTLFYRDAFGFDRSTVFSFSFGGPDFRKHIRVGKGTGWNWHHGQHHNEPT